MRTILPAPILAVALTVVVACTNDAAPGTTGLPSTTALSTTSSNTSPTTTPPLVPSTSGGPGSTTITITTTGEPARRYVFPVQPPDVADYGSDHHDYPATDIFAPMGTSLVAVTEGVVEEVWRGDDWDPSKDDPATRGGRFVSIIGDDGVRYYYSHLDEVTPDIEAGLRVDAGRVIGTVGKSGNARDTPAHVHFGLSRPTFPGDWVVRRGEIPPYDYLQAWAAGEEMAPRLP